MKLLNGFTREHLCALYKYDRITGHLTSRIAKGRYYAGRVVGTVEDNGYIRVSVEGTLIRAHRIIWFIETGEVPDQVDHENLNKGDNRWDNLRAATASENGGNIPVNTANKSGFKGVSFERWSSTWRACIRDNQSGKTKKLGRFPNKLHAAVAYNFAADKHFGSFARLNEIPGVGKLAVPVDSIGLYL